MNLSMIKWIGVTVASVAVTVFVGKEAVGEIISSLPIGNKEESKASEISED